MCLLCGDPPDQPTLGTFLTSIHCHQLCIKFSTGLKKNKNTLPKDVEIVREVKRCRKLTCVYCKRKGASVTCNGEDCSRSYHLGCGMARGVLNRHSDCSSYCPTHVPFPALSAPSPRPSCPLCDKPVGQDLLQCPACSCLMDRSCLDSRAAGGLSSCPKCGDSQAFSELSERFGIWFRDASSEAVLLRPGSLAPSPTISYLARECSLPATSLLSPTLVTNKLSPMQQHLAQARSRTWPVRSLRSDEPIVTLVATPSPTKASPSPTKVTPSPTKASPPPSDSDVQCVSPTGWLSTPGESKTFRTSVIPRKVKSLPGKLLKSPNNHLISTFFKPVSKRSDASCSEVEVVDPTSSSKDTSSKDTSARPTREPSPLRSPLSPSKKPSSPFKAIRMSTTKAPGITKVIRPVMKIEFSSDTGTEGPLSDIDDILSGSVVDLETHPLADIVFAKSNPHLKEIMKKISGSELDEPKAAAVEDDGVEGEPEKKKKERKPKKKEDGPRRQVLKKEAGKRRYSGSSDSGAGARRKIVIQKLPLAARQIYHGRNWVPMTTYGEGEVEEECEFSWVVDYTGKKLEDIVDLNSAEKTMMNLWNAHVIKYQGRGIIHMDSVVTAFLTESSHTIVELNLYRNFVSHMSGLHQAHVISSEALFNCINNMQDVMKVLEEHSTVVGPVWVKQRERAMEKELREGRETGGGQDMTASPGRMVRSASRVRINSGLPGCSSPGLAAASSPRKGSSSLAGVSSSSLAIVSSPTKALLGSPGQCRSPSRANGAASPSRPNSIGRGRRSSNWNKNVQKSLDFEHKQLPAVERLAGETTPGKSARGSLAARSPVRSQESGGDTSSSETGQEVASFLSTFPGPLPNPHLKAIFPGVGEKVVEEGEVHVLTEDPDSDAEEEEEEEDDCEEGGEGEAEPAAGEAPRRLPRGGAAGGKDFLGLQEEERQARLARWREKDPMGVKVPVLYVSDDIIEVGEDRLAEVKPQEEPKVTALRKLFLKQREKKAEAKRKATEKIESKAKRARIEDLLQDSN